MEEVKHVFKPEFINRIDEMIVFHALNKENIQKIADIMVDAFINRVKEQTDIVLDVSQEVRDFVAEKGFDKDYGARPIRRALQNRVEDVMAEALLFGEVSMGEHAEAVLVKNDGECKVEIHAICE